MQSALDALRAELNELKNAGGKAPDLSAIKAEIAGLQDALKSLALAQSPAAQGQQQQETEKHDTTQKIRLGFW